LHSFDGLSYSSWLIAIKIDWLSSINLAEVTSPGALVATDKESGFAIFPAFKNVRASSFLAHSVQAFGLNKIHDLGVLGTSL
jgi:hypothetical protein